MYIGLLPTINVDFGNLTKAFNLAYSDYLVPLQLSEEQLRNTHHQTDTNMQLSLAALVNGKIVGMGFLCVRQQRGWIGGMGVIPEYRRYGIGREIMNGLIGNARKIGIKTVQLEVIEGNDPAHRLYLDIGFEPTRRLLIIQAAPIASVIANADDYTVQPSDLTTVLDFYDDLHSVPNPWQREATSLRKANDLSAWIGRVENDVVGYVIGRTPERMIQIMDAAFRPEHPLALETILQKLWQQQPDVPASMVNLPDDDPAWPVFEHMGFSEHLAQIEMSLTL